MCHQYERRRAVSTPSIQTLKSSASAPVINVPNSIRLNLANLSTATRTAQGIRNFTLPRSHHYSVIQRKPTFDADKSDFEQWMQTEEKDPGDIFFKKSNHVYESISAGRVGSIYFGSGKGGEGGRLRLLHPLGPKISHYNHVTRNVESGRILEEMNNNGDESYTHTSRGCAGHNRVVSQMNDQDFEILTRAVRYSMKLKADYIKEQQQIRKDTGMDECSGEALRILEEEAANRANNFLFAFIDSNPGLTIPLNETGFNQNKDYYTRRQELSSIDLSISPSCMPRTKCCC